jgi:magnesium transporter
MKVKRPKFNTKRKKKVSRVQGKMGKAPGTVNYLGNKEKTSSKVHIIEYGPEEYNEFDSADAENIVTVTANHLNSWVNVIGISDEAFIEDLGKRFELSPLVMEDAVNTEQRPKIDEYEDYIFGVFKMIYINGEEEIIGEHMAIVLKKEVVIVFQEVEDDVFKGVRERIFTKSGRIRSRRADYLFFALLDAVIDHYFLVLEYLGNKIDQLEEEVYENPKPEVAKRIQMLKKDVLKVRRWISPVKELISRLIETDSSLITKDTKPFLRDVHDHTLEINESLQIYREMSMSLMEMYMSNMSNKMNEVMKVLTIMASIFIPLTFIAGVYGMNFQHMPELQWEYGYYYVWGLMILLFLVLLIYFKKKNWL